MGSQATGSSQVQQTSQQSQQQGRSVSQPMDFLQGPLRGLAMANYGFGTTTDPYTPASANTKAYWAEAPTFGTTGLAGGSLDPQRDSYVASVLSGKGLDINNDPYFKGAVNAYLAPQTDNFLKTVAPGAASAFGLASRTASGAASNVMQQLADNFNRTTGDAISGMAENAYQQALQRQMGVLGMLPTLQAGDLQRDLQRISLMGQAGQAEDAYTQAQKMAPLDLLTRTGLGMLSLAPGGVTDTSGWSSGNGTTTGYSMPGSTGDSWLGAALGLGARALPLMFSSDRRDKTDIDKLGIDPLTGLPMYAYRYKSDPKTYPKVVGPMAQDMARREGPWRVRELGGHKVVMGGLV